MKTIVLKVEDYDQFWAWSLATARKIDRKESLTECHEIAFGDPEDMFAFLASPLLARLYAIQERPMGLAEQVDDEVVARLANLGLVEVTDGVVRAVSRQIKLEVLLAPSAREADGASSFSPL